MQLAQAEQQALLVQTDLLVAQVRRVLFTSPHSFKE
jgi:hypothetical protein